MTKQAAQSILQYMLEGIDPVTGEVLPQGHLCHEPDVIRALHIAVMALQEKERPADGMVNRKNGQLNAGRPWTDEDVEELVRLYRTGVPIEEMCGALQRRERGIKKQLALLGLMGEKVKTPAGVAGMERAGQRWTDQEDDMLRELANEKWSVDEIARAMHRSEYAIYCHMEKLDIYDEEVPGYPLQDDLPRWSDEDNRRLQELFLQGKSLEELADCFGRKKESISARLFYQGLIRQAPGTLLIRRD